MSHLKMALAVICYNNLINIHEFVPFSTTSQGIVEWALQDSSISIVVVIV